MTALAVAGLVCALAGCKREGRVGVNLPRYPGASYHPQDRSDVAGATIYRGELWTPDIYRLVAEFYDKELGVKPEWKRSGGRDIRVWTNGNMKPGHNMKGEVVDPTKRGAMVVIYDDAVKTRVVLVEALPAEAE